MLSTHDIPKMSDKCLNYHITKSFLDIMNLLPEKHPHSLHYDNTKNILTDKSTYFHISLYFHSRSKFCIVQ